MDNNSYKTEIANKRLVNLGALLVLILSLLGLVSLYASKGTKIYKEGQSVKEVNTFEGVVVEAESALVWDVKNQKVLFEKNPEIILPLASLTKLIVANTALDLVPANTVISIKKEFLLEDGDSGLLVNENWRLKDLLDVSLVASSNDAATAIAAVAGAVSVNKSDNFEIGREVFIQKMNEKAKSIGMTSTHITRENGLDFNGQEGGAYGSAMDMVKLFEYTLKAHPDVFDATKYPEVRSESLNDVTHRVKNTNPVVNSIPSLIGSKTGYTDLSKGNLVTIIDPAIGRPIIVVVLASSYDGRFTDTLRLANAATAYLSLNK